MPDVTYVWTPQEQDNETWIPFVVQSAQNVIPKKCRLPFFLFSVGAVTGRSIFIPVDRWIKLSDRVEIWQKEP